MTNEWVRCTGFLLVLLLLLDGCARPAPHGTRAEGEPVLRAVYRDTTHHLLVALPDGTRGRPHGDCAAPLLIDDLTGGARQITVGEATNWMRHMQLSGAARGTCP